MSNDKTTATERNAFDIALQYATGIKIGADWREIALGRLNSEYGWRGDGGMLFVGCNGCPPAVEITADDPGATIANGWSDLTGDFTIAIPFVVIATNGDVSRYESSPIGLGADDFAGGAVCVSADWWDGAVAYDEIIHRKPSWRERAAEAARPLVDGTVRREVGNSIVVGDDSDADAEVAE